jgi:hypothetical protein
MTDHWSNLDSTLRKIDELTSTPSELPVAPKLGATEEDDTLDIPSGIDPLAGARLANLMLTPTPTGAANTLVHVPCDEDPSLTPPYTVTRSRRTWLDRIRRRPR